MNFILRVTVIWRGATPSTHNQGFKSWHDALNNAVDEMESLRRCAEDPAVSCIIGYRVEITEWLGANTYKTRLKAEYQNEEWRTEDGK